MKKRKIKNIKTWSAGSRKATLTTRCAGHGTGRTASTASLMLTTISGCTDGNIKKQKHWQRQLSEVLGCQVTKKSNEQHSHVVAYNWLSFSSGLLEAPPFPGRLISTGWRNMAFSSPPCLASARNLSPSKNLCRNILSLYLDYLDESL